MQSPAQAWPLVATFQLLHLVMTTTTRKPARNAVTKETCTVAPSLKDARAFCGQRLLKTAHERTRTLSDLAAGLIDVCEARGTACPGVWNPGF